MLSHVWPQRFLGLRLFSGGATQAAASSISNATIKVEEKPFDAKETQDQLKKIQERNLFLLAEVENARRRFQRLEKELELTAVSDFAQKLLPVADNFGRLINNGTKQDVNSVLEAVKMIDADFHKVFKQFQIEKIVSLGKKFDPSFHDAMQVIDTEGKSESGTIVDCIIDGYTLGTKLLRPAKVIVAK